MTLTHALLLVLFVAVAIAGLVLCRSLIAVKRRLNSIQERLDDVVRSVPESQQLRIRLASLERTHSAEITQLQSSLPTAPRIHGDDLTNRQVSDDYAEACAPIWEEIEKRTKQHETERAQIQKQIENEMVNERAATCP